MREVQLVFGLAIAAGGACAQEPCAPRWQGFALNDAGHVLYADASGPTLYVGGSFTTPAAYIAAFTGDGFAPVGGNLHGDVRSITRHNDGGGSTLYVAGFIGVPRSAGFSDNVARLENGAFVPFGSAGTSSWMSALTSYNFGAGPRLMGSGGFGFPCEYVTEWTGSAWQCMGQGLGSVVTDSVVFDDGSGRALFCVGSLIVNGAPFSEGIGIGKWNGTAWSTVNGGIRGGSGTTCTVFDAGSGPELIVGGSFLGAGPTSGWTQARNIARWNGQRWAPLGAGLNNQVRALAVFDDGSGPKLYAAGDFTIAGTAPAQRLARWDGTAWSACPAGGVPTGTINDMTVFDPDGNGPQMPYLAVTGSFGAVAGGAIAAANFALLVPGRSTGDFNQDGGVDGADVEAFFESWEAGDAAADLNGDGGVDGSDVAAFFVAWSSGLCG
ncbi:MAG: hypothetical protein JSR77_13505 [Planctomycetes bacterium]|nr:hypothetical protein [Planctomycetota bacterium]